ncbi:MAG TPA: ATP-binding protein, partial [Polyangiaceae bacterium]|nr:ATP-binding protein [Polyangiaceae bacterium]
IRLELIYQKLEQSGEWTGELRHTTRDGRELIVESRQQLVRAYGQVWVLESNRDITERKRAEAELRDADRRKDQFIAMLAHELRNPLAPVRNAVEILKRSGTDGPQLSRARDVIARQVTHMTRLVDDLLDVSRIARGKLELQKQPCDLRGIVHQTADDYRATLEVAGLTLTIDEGTEPLWVEGDPVRLAQMVGNLLHNASRFTPSGGRVRVRTSRDTGSRQAVVSVADTGTGMEPSFLSRLFDPFSQADQDFARSKGGLGLGLALTRGLVELHGGRVEAHSPGPGQGSTFVLRVPLSESRQRMEPSSSTPAARDRPLRILVVEDNADAAETLGELLTLQGHQVKLALDGAAGVALAREFRPDVVISDLGLPGEFDGYAVARSLRREPSLSRIHLIALSGYASDDARRRSSEAGFQAHFAKPPDLPKLEQTLNAVASSLDSDRHASAPRA